jgi:hypothetical protein
VSNNKKKRKKPAGGSSPYRAPAQAAKPARRGLFDGLLAPRTPGGSPMPKLRRTIARGFVTATSIPWLIVAIPVTVFVVWELLVLAGFRGPFTGLNVTFAIPPVTTFADTQIAGKAFRAGVDASGAGATAIGIGGFAIILLFHAAIDAVVASVSVEKLRTGTVSMWAVRRAAHVLPITASIGFISLGLLIAGNVLAAFLGAIGVIFGLLGSMALGVYLFGFAPAVAADEDRRFADTLVRSIRVARMPGSANLWLALGYVLVSLLTLLLPLPGASIGVTPSPAAWATTIVVNLMHVVMQSTLAYRYLVVAPEVPEGAPERRSAAAR